MKDHRNYREKHDCTVLVNARDFSLWRESMRCATNA